MPNVSIKPNLAKYISHTMQKYAKCHINKYIFSHTEAKQRLKGEMPQFNASFNPYLLVISISRPIRLQKDGS